MIEKENLIMKESLLSLRHLGGKASRKEIKREIRDHSDKISESTVDERRVSKKSGRKYSPFEYRFNFSIKHLIKAGFISTADNKTLELTNKGLSVNVEFMDIDKDVRSISEEAVKKESKLQVEEDDKAELWREELLTALKSMSPRKFEIFCNGLLKRMGVDLDNNIGTKYSADGGLDGFGYVTSDDFRTTRVALQCKRWQNNVQSPEIDKFRGAMDKYNAEFGIFITTSDFSRTAKENSRVGTRVITLVNGDDICDLVAKYNFFVEPVTTYKLQSFYTEKG